MKAGSAVVEITPKAGTHLAGSGKGDYRPAQSVIDPLYARAAVFESEGRRVCTVALDVLCITEEYTALIREAARERFGLDPDAILVHSLQNHSAPSCGPMMFDPDFPLELPTELEYLTGAESSYSTYAAERAIEAIGLACGALRSIQIGVGRGIRADLAFNRRAVMRDGRVAMPGLYSSVQKPLGPTDICYMEGPVDPEVGVLCARDESMHMAAVLLHYSCHPVNVFATDYYAVSADWPGSWAQGMQRAYGEQCVPLVLNGCCGNINPWPPFDADFVPNHRRMGTELADMACKVIRKMVFADQLALNYGVRRIYLPYRQIPYDRQAGVDKMISEYPAPKWSKEDKTKIDPKWFRAVSTKSIEYCRARWPDGFPYEVQVLRIGNVAVVGLPGEPFSEGQLAIKLASPAEFTYVAHMTSHYVGYIPTKDACLRGGHEANADYTYWAKLAPESLDIVVDTAVELAKQVFSE